MKNIVSLSEEPQKKDTSQSSSSLKSQSVKLFGKEFNQKLKLQSAMEYLMTYGWAILIIAVVLVALFQMGVFNSANFAPKAQPGSCQVFKTVAATSLEGTCNNELPQYVAQFDGVDSVINLDSVPKPSLPITFVMWINPNTDNPTGMFDADPGQPYDLRSGSPGNVEWWNANPLVPLGLSARNWYMLVFVYRQTSVNIIDYYRNGALIGTYSGTSATGYNFFNMQLGLSTNVGYYNGIIANVQIYNTSLSANDVQALYQEGIGGAPQNTQNLVGWWPLNGNANDYSGNNNNGAATNVIYTGSWTSGYSAP